jgi:chromosome segregation ATPase
MDGKCIFCNRPLTSGDTNGICGSCNAEANWARKTITYQNKSIDHLRAELASNRLEIEGLRAENAELKDAANTWRLQWEEVTKAGLEVSGMYFRLEKENAELRRERDAAVDTIRRASKNCNHWDCAVKEWLQSPAEEGGSGNDKV